MYSSNKIERTESQTLYTIQDTIQIQEKIITLTHDRHILEYLLY